MTDKSSWQPTTLGNHVQEHRWRVADPVAAGIERCVRGDDFDSGETRLARWGRVPEDMGPTFNKGFRAGHVLYMTRRAYLRKAAVPDFDGVSANTTLVLEVTSDELLPELLPYLLQTDAFTEYAVGVSVGSTNPFTKWSDLRNFEFLLPPPQQQRELVELLHGIDEAIEAGTETLESTLIARNSSFKELIRPKGKRKGLKVSDMASVMIGRQLSPSKKQGVRPVDYLRAINVNGGKIGLLDINSMDFSEEEEKKYRIYEGDTLIVEGGASVGHCAKFTSDMGKFCFQNTLLRLRPKDPIDADLLYYAVLALHTEGTLEKMAKGSGIKHLGVKGVENLEFELPTDPKERRSILDTIKAMEKLAHDLHSNVTNLRTLRAAILNTSLSPAPATTTAPAPALVPA